MTKFDWEKIAKDLILALGGKKNLSSFQHCATRFRFYVKNASKVNKSKIRKINLVKGINKEGEQWQIIFGPGTVNKIHDAVLLLTKHNVSKTK